MNKKKKNYLFELDNRQMVMVFAGLAVVCLLVFSAGFMAGSRSAREELQLAKKSVDYREKIRAPRLIKERLEQEKKEEKPTQTVPIKPQKSIEAVIESATKEEKKVSSEKVASTKPAKAAGETKKEDSKESAKKEPDPPAAKEEKQFFVQVASFPAEKDAAHKESELKKRGYRALVVKAEIPGKGTYYRVRIGPFNRLDRAKAFALAFEKKEKAATFIAQD